jgi:hypothetical protein
MGGRLRRWSQGDLTTAREESYSEPSGDFCTPRSHAGNLSIQSGYRILPSRHQLRPPRPPFCSLTSQLGSLTSQNSRGKLSPQKKQVWSLWPQTTHPDLFIVRLHNLLEYSPAGQGRAALLLARPWALGALDKAGSLQSKAVPMAPWSHCLLFQRRNS